MILKYKNGVLAGKETLLRPPGISIGREIDNDVQLLVAGVSRYHAKITFDGNRWTLADLGSTNGTKLNGVKLTSPAALKSGDIILIGDQEICAEESDGRKSSKSATAPVPVLTPKPSDTLVSGAAPVVSVTPPVAPSDVTIRKITPEPLKNSAPSAEQNPPASEEKSPKDAGSLLDTLKKAAGSGSLFSGNHKDGNPPAEGGDAKRSSRMNGKLGNLIFGLLVVMFALVGIYIFLQVSKGSGDNSSEEAASAEAPMPFYLEYERQVITRDNVFRFSLLIDQGKAEFVLDDLRFGRHFEKIIPKVSEEQLESLKNRIRRSEFIKYRPPADNKIMVEEEDRRSLSVGIDGKFNSVSARKDSLSRSFEDIVSAIEKFAMTNDVRAAMLGVDEMKREAMTAFRNGQQFFDNRDARPENLRKAITHFKFAMDFLADFDPRPPEYREAAKRLEEANTLMRQKRNAIHDEIYRLYKLKQFREGAARCQEIMELIGEEDPKYLDYKEFKMAFEKEAGGKKKGK